MSWDEEELFFNRKELKHAKKARKSQDTSRYKRSNQNKLKIPDEKVLYTKGLVQCISSQEIITLNFETKKSHLCTLRGGLKQEQKRLKNLVVVGDYVDYDPINEKQGIIYKVLPRSSFLSRAGACAKNKEHIIAANLDQLLITMTLKEPAIKWSLVDRFLIASTQGNTTPVIVINKIDLLTSKEEQEELKDMVATYRALGVIVLTLSAKALQGTDALKDLLKDKVSSFVGPSGTGKSTILSSILGRKLRVGELASHTQKGAHTTTRGEIFFLPDGGSCIDTPGIKSFALWDSPEKDLQKYFTEILEASQDCKFPNCYHIQEPLCAVKNKVESGEIHKKRYNSYKYIFENLGKKDLSR